MNITNSRLKYNSVYLSGNMESAFQAKKIWRNNISPFLKSLGMVVFNPYNKDQLIHSFHRNGLEDDATHELKLQSVTNKNWDLLQSIMKNIVSLDLRQVDKCDVIITNLDLSGPICGTYQEIFTAEKQNKPILVCCEQGIKNIPMWLRGVLPPELLFDNLEEIKEYLWHIAYDSDDTINCLGRWKFFDIEKEILQIVCQDNVVVPIERYETLLEKEMMLDQLLSAKG